MKTIKIDLNIIHKSRVSYIPLLFTILSKMTLPHARFIFHHPKNIDDELIINGRNKETNTYFIVYKQPSCDNNVRSWNCPADNLTTYISRFFQFMYMDKKKPEWMQVDCEMYPSIQIKFANNMQEVERAVTIVIDMMKTL